MVASTGSTGKGVFFQIDLLASPATWFTVANVRSMNFTGRQGDDVDFTHLLSTGSYREFRQGFKDGGSIGLDFHFNIAEATHTGTTGLLGLFNSGVNFNWRINFTAIAAFGMTGVGYVQNPGDISMDVDGPIMGSASVRVTGQSTLVAIP